MTENEDKLSNNNLKRFMKIENYHILDNMFLILISILNNYLRLYYQDILALLNMKFISENKISEELVNSFDEEMTLELAKRLEEDNYNTPFDGLKDWHLLRALAINRPELTTDYIHLLDQEPFDEN